MLSILLSHAVYARGLLSTNMYPVRWDCIFSSSKSPTCPATTIDKLMPQKFRYITKREAIPAEKVQSFFDNKEVASLTAFESTFPFISR